jgi:hypothetical protein
MERRLYLWTWKDIDMVQDLDLCNRMNSHGMDALRPWRSISVACFNT